MMLQVIELVIQHGGLAVYKLTDWIAMQFVDFLWDLDTVSSGCSFYDLIIKIFLLAEWLLLKEGN